MIILAAAIILSLNSSGIIGKANKAITDSDIANAKHAVSLEYSEWKLDNELQTTYSGVFSTYAKEKLANAGFSEELIAKLDISEETGEVTINDSTLEPTPDPDPTPDPEPEPETRETITFRVNCSCGEAYYDFTAYEGDTWGEWYENSEFDNYDIVWERGYFIITGYTEGYITKDAEGSCVSYDDPIEACGSDGSTPYEVWHGDYGQHR